MAKKDRVRHTPKKAPKATQKDKRRARRERSRAHRQGLLEHIH